MSESLDSGAERGREGREYSAGGREWGRKDVEGRGRDFLTQSSLVVSRIGCTVWGQEGAASKVGAGSFGQIVNSQIVRLPLPCDDGSFLFSMSVSFKPSVVGQSSSSQYCWPKEAGFILLPSPCQVHLSALEIGNLIFLRAKKIPDSVGYATTGLCCAVVIALTPLAFKLEALGEMIHQVSNSAVC